MVTLANNTCVTLRPCHDGMPRLVVASRQWRYVQKSHRSFLAGPHHPVMGFWRCPLKRNGLWSKRAAIKLLHLVKASPQPPRKPGRLLATTLRSTSFLLLVTGMDEESVPDPNIYTTRIWSERPGRKRAWVEDIRTG